MTNRLPNLDGIFHTALRAVWLRLAILACVTLMIAAACAGHRRGPATTRPGHTERGLASWYGGKFHGRPTANGERYDMHGMTAAHKKLPLGTLIEVTHLGNGKRVRVRVNDRGPFIRGRILDLSRGAADALGMVHEGVAKVKIKVLELDVPPARLASSSGRALPAEQRYAVQVASFRDRDRALDQLLRLQEHYRDVEIRAENGWHRVQVGRFDTKRKAESLRRRLLARDEAEQAVIVAVPAS